MYLNGDISHFELLSLKGLDGDYALNGLWNYLI